MTDDGHHHPHVHRATGDHGPHSTYIGNMLDPQTGDQAAKKTFGTVDPSQPLGPTFVPGRMDVPEGECALGDGEVEVTDNSLGRTGGVVETHDEKKEHKPSLMDKLDRFMGAGKKPTFDKGIGGKGDWRSTPEEGYTHSEAELAGMDVKRGD